MALINEQFHIVCDVEVMRAENDVELSLENSDILP